MSGRGAEVQEGTVRGRGVVRETVARGAQGSARRQRGESEHGSVRPRAGGAGESVHERTLRVHRTVMDIVLGVASHQLRAVREATGCTEVVVVDEWAADDFRLVVVKAKEREPCVMAETLLLKIQVAGLAVDEGTLRDIDEDMSRRGQRR